MSTQNKVTPADRKPAESAFAVGPNLSFAALEAYKRLRTNLLFSFADKPGCKVICTSSSMRGEGKTTTSCNLGYALAEAGKKTLILDGDMRLPQVHKVLNLRQAPGLSNLLTGINTDESLIQPAGIHDLLSVIAAGDIPPNPSELLASKKMGDIIGLLRKEFDFVLIDLPPIDAVADALIVSKLTDGLILVVRENYVDKAALSSSMRQLKFQQVNLLGFVLNGSTSESSRYYRGSYYKKSYYKEGYAPDSDFS